MMIVTIAVSTVNDKPHNDNDNTWQQLLLIITMMIINKNDTIANISFSPLGRLFSPSKRKKRFEGEKWRPEGEKH